MKSLKKSVIAVLVIGILSVAGMALAQPHGNRQHGPMGPFGGPMFGQQPAPFPPMWGQNFFGPEFGLGRGPAFGNGPRHFQPFGQFAPVRPQGFCGCGFGHGRHGRGPAFGPEGCGPRGKRFQRHGRFSPDMPQEIRSRAVEAAKLRIDLEDVLSRKPLNREKALELKGKIGKLEQEIRAWRFEQKLNRIEEFNRKAAEEAGKPEQAEEK